MFRVPFIAIHLYYTFNMISSTLTDSVEFVSNTILQFRHTAIFVLLLVAVIAYALRDSKPHLKNVPLLNPSPRLALTNRKSKVS